MKKGKIVERAAPGCERGEGHRGARDVERGTPEHREDGHHTAVWLTRVVYLSLSHANTHSLSLSLSLSRSLSLSLTHTHTRTRTHTHTHAHALSLSLFFSPRRTHTLSLIRSLSLSLVVPKTPKEVREPRLMDSPATFREEILVLGSGCAALAFWGCGRDCVKSLRSSYMELYPQKHSLLGFTSAVQGLMLKSRFRIRGLQFGDWGLGELPCDVALDGGLKGPQSVMVTKTEVSDGD